MWSQPFSQYYMSTVNVVIKHLGWWELQQFQIDRATTNQSEACQYSYKTAAELEGSTDRFNGTKSTPVDRFPADRNQKRYERAWQLCSTWRNRSNTMGLRINRCHSARRHRWSYPMNLEVLGSRTTDETDVSQPSTSHVLTQSTPSHDIEEHNPVEPQPQSSNPEVNNASVNERSCPRHQLQKHWTESTSWQYLLYIGTVEPRVVRLFPSISCSCPAKSQCYHMNTIYVICVNMYVILNSEFFFKLLNINLA